MISPIFAIVLSKFCCIKQLFFILSVISHSSTRFTTAFVLLFLEPLFNFNPPSSFSAFCPHTTMGYLLTISFSVISQRSFLPHCNVLLVVFRVENSIYIVSSFFYVTHMIKGLFILESPILCPSD